MRAWGLDVLLLPLQVEDEASGMRRRPREGCRAALAAAVDEGVQAAGWWSHAPIWREAAGSARPYVGAVGVR